MNMIQLKGVDHVIKNLRRSSNDAVAVRCSRGLKKAGLLLQRLSQNVVPVQTGNLKNSAFTRSVGAGFFTHVVVGYTANYAAYVHEDLSKAHGQEFNVKHRDEIAKAGQWSSNINTKRTTFKLRGQAGTAAGGMFPRGENQQAKFLESPARENRKLLLSTIANG